MQSSSICYYSRTVEFVSRFTIKTRWTPSNYRKNASGKLYPCVHNPATRNTYIYNPTKANFQSMFVCCARFILATAYLMQQTTNFILATLTTWYSGFYIKFLISLRSILLTYINLVNCFLKHKLDGWMFTLASYAAIFNNLHSQPLQKNLHAIPIISLLPEKPISLSSKLYFSVRCALLLKPTHGNNVARIAFVFNKIWSV